MAIEQPVQALSILIAEDNADTADSLARFLRLGFGYDVTIAWDGPQAVRAALAQPPDVVVCDIGLPRKNGLLVAEELIERLPRRPLMIAVTGYGNQVKREHAADAGFDHYFVKPADPFAIEAVIDDYVHGRAGA